jgi:4-aminobutyrate aminotransferase
MKKYEDLWGDIKDPKMNVLTECKGIFVKDINGKEYMDFHGRCSHNIGFRHNKVIEAVKKQLETLPFCSGHFTNIPAIMLAEKLVEIAPQGLGKCLFCPSGTGAMGIATRISMKNTRKFKMVSLWDSYYGSTIELLGVGGQLGHRQAFSPILHGAEHVPPPYCYRCPFELEYPDCDLLCSKMIEYTIRKEGTESISAVIMDSMVGLGMPSDYLPGVRKICDDYGVHLIIDEVYEGLGRTGKMFACENYGVVPDIVGIGKSLGGGVMPVAAVIFSNKIDIGPSLHNYVGHTSFDENPLMCAAALTTLEVLVEEKLVEKSAELGDYVLKRLYDMRDEHELIGDVRGKGLCIQVELVKNRNTKEPAIEEGQTVRRKTLEKGCNFAGGKHIFGLYPPLTITRGELDTAINILDESLNEIDRS